MQGMPPPAADERQTLIEFLRFNQNAFFAVAYGLTDEQARSKPSVSALSIGGLVKHAAGVQHSWMARVKAAPDSPPGTSGRSRNRSSSRRTSTSCVTTRRSMNCSTS